MNPEERERIKKEVKKQLQGVIDTLDLAWVDGFEILDLKDPNEIIKSFSTAVDYIGTPSFSEISEMIFPILEKAKHTNEKAYSEIHNEFLNRYFSEYRVVTEYMDIIKKSEKYLTEREKILLLISTYLTFFEGLYSTFISYIILFGIIGGDFIYHNNKLVDRLESVEKVPIGTRLNILRRKLSKCKTKKVSQWCDKYLLADEITTRNYIAHMNFKITKNNDIRFGENKIVSNEDFGSKLSTLAFNCSYLGCALAFFEFMPLAEAFKENPSLRAELEAIFK